MNIAWAVACRYAEVHDGLATIVGAGADTIGTPGVPIPIALPFIVRFTIEQGDSGIEHTISSTVLGVDMEPTGDPMTAKARFDSEQLHSQPGWNGSMMQPMMVQWLATQAGVYTVVFDVDGRSFDVPVIVNVAPPT